MALHTYKKYFLEWSFRFQRKQKDGPELYPGFCQISVLICFEKEELQTCSRRLKFLKELEKKYDTNNKKNFANLPETLFSPELQILILHVCIGTPEPLKSPFSPFFLVGV